MTTPVVLGSTRQMWLANLSDAAPQWSFLEDPVGTTKRGAQFGRTLRLGDPISLGANSVWHQLSWEGGEGQDIWNDKQMYQWGDADVLTNSGKARMWPGFQAWLKWENMGQGSRSVAFSQGTRGDTAWMQQVLYVASRDGGPYETQSAHYHLYQLHPGYARGDSRMVQMVDTKTEPYRFIIQAYDDTGSFGIQNVATRSKFYQLIESTHTMVQDTGAPAQSADTGDFIWDSGVSFNEAFYYLRGNNLYKRVPKAPYGTVGTHTRIKKIASAWYARGLVVYNNRLYFSVLYPNGRAAVFVSDGSTTTKAFDFPGQFQPVKLLVVAGALYMLGMQTADLHGNGLQLGGGQAGNAVQQLWRYDGSSLKKLWQEGNFSDGEVHWASDLVNYQGWVCWGRQGTATNAKANLMFYDPVRDAIVRGPGLELVPSNVGSDSGRGLWIMGLHVWHNTVALYFKDDTTYSSSVNRPGCIVTMRPENYVRHDLRWNTADQLGDVLQFQGHNSLGSQFTNSARICSSEYHGTDDVAVETKTWLSVRLRYRITGNAAKIKVYAIPNPSTLSLAGTQITDSGAVLVSTVNYPGDALYHDIVIPVKDGSGAYLQSQKIQFIFSLENTSGVVDSTDNAWIDDSAISWQVFPKKARQWQVRVPCTEAQLRLDGTANPLATADTLAQKLEDLFFASAPVKFWEPADATATPGNGAFVETRISEFQRQQSRVASNETGDIGYVTMTLIENVLS